MWSKLFGGVVPSCPPFPKCEGAAMRSLWNLSESSHWLHTSVDITTKLHPLKHWMEFIQFNFSFPIIESFSSLSVTEIISIGCTSGVRKAGAVVILHNDERVQTTLPYPLSGTQSGCIVRLVPFYFLVFKPLFHVVAVLPSYRLQ